MIVVMIQFSQYFLFILEDDIWEYVILDFVNRKIKNFVKLISREKKWLYVNHLLAIVVLFHRIWFSARYYLGYLKLHKYGCRESKQENNFEKPETLKPRNESFFLWKLILCFVIIIIILTSFLCSIKCCDLLFLNWSDLNYYCGSFFLLLILCIRSILELLISRKEKSNHRSYRLSRLKKMIFANDLNNKNKICYTLVLWFRDLLKVSLFKLFFAQKFFLSLLSSKVNDIMRGEPAVIASTRNFEISRRFFSFNILDLGQLKYS